MTRVDVRYFAVFRDQAGTHAEQIDTVAQTAQALYDELKSRHGFTLDTTSVRVAINDEFCDWGCPINEGDNVVFIPPVAGG